MMRLIALVIFLVLIIAGFAFLSGQSLDLARLSDLVENAQQWKTAQPWLVAVVFFVIYVAVTALSLPLAVWLTLAAGALFGSFYGLILVSFASTIGATISFLAARFMLREVVQARFGDKLVAVNSGLEKDGAFYLFTLRLIPIVPFFAVNLLMGLTKIRASTFYLVSQIGMLAGTLVYVNAGTQLSKIQSLSEITSPKIILSFALLGVFPWFARLVIRLVKRRKVYGAWRRPARFDRNLVVIGAGAAGLVSAYIGAAVKAKVTLIESHKMGGDCLNYGCVPSKALIKSAKVAHQMRHGDHYGLTATMPTFSFRAVMARVQRVIADIEPHDSVARYEGLGAEVLQGHAKIIDPWTVEVATDTGVQRLTTRSIIIATGAAPFVPPLPGLEEVGYLTSDTMWQALTNRDAVPQRMVILGGGPIGSELAQAFARLGAQVSQVERGARLLAREDTDAATVVESALRADGVEILTDHLAVACGISDGEKWLEVECNGSHRKIAFDEIIIAVGRAPRLTGFGLEDLGIPVKKIVETNEYLETIYPNIFAAGDVAGPYQFTHTAAHQAWFATVNALFGVVWRFKADYRVIPWTTFVDPEVARVGLSENEANAQGIAHEVTRYAMDDLDRAIADSSTAGFVKVLTVPGKDKILGVTIVGAHAGDLLAEYILAMKHGLGLNKILGTIHTYPTLAEANKFAAGEWKKAHVNPRVVRLSERFHAWRRGT